MNFSNIKALPFGTGSCKKHQQIIADTPVDRTASYNSTLPRQRAEPCRAHFGLIDIWSFYTNK